MAGETDLTKLLAAMRPALQPETYVFVTLKPGEATPQSLTPIMTFHESEGLTLIVPEEEARRAGLDRAFPSRLITLEVHSSLSAVGFLAEIAARLAGAGIPVNAVSAYFHDHLFVPVDRAEEAMRRSRADSGSVDPRILRPRDAPRLISGLEHADSAGFPISARAAGDGIRQGDPCPQGREDRAC